MDDRERLVEILESAESAFYWNSSDKTFVEKIADHLIANGVTVQKHGRWITANDGTHFCSECGCDAQYAWDDIDRFFINSADDVPDRISDYCPNCGAKIDA